MFNYEVSTIQLNMIRYDLGAKDPQELRAQGVEEVTRQMLVKHGIPITPKNRDAVSIVVKHKLNN